MAKVIGALLQCRCERGESMQTYILGREGLEFIDLDLFMIYLTMSPLASNGKINDELETAVEGNSHDII
jgi:hypothetical protein